MVFSQRFAVRLATRTVALLVATTIAAALLTWGRAPTATLLAMALTFGSAMALWHLVAEGNAQLSRFILALEQGDLTQGFARLGRGTEFERLGSAYDGALRRLRSEQAKSLGDVRFGEALLDVAPAALLVVDGHETVAFPNRAARHLFGRSDPCAIELLAPFGCSFVEALRGAQPGPTRLINLVVDGLAQRVTLDVTAMEHAGATRRIVAVKVIQAELDGAELATQLDLVRVLTHEIMNSLTPVTSLAGTAMRATAALDPQLAPGMADAQRATAVLANRAMELERFVDSYKEFSEAPAIHRQPVAVADWLEQVMRLFVATSYAERIATSLHVAASTPHLLGDAALLTQVMLNLLKNAAEATIEQPDPAVTIAASAGEHGAVRIVVTDNGPGIPAHLAQEVFLPFFTTKRTGTGIGLSFTRRVVLLHGGQIGVCSSTVGGGGIEMLLPSVSEPVRNGR